MLINQNLTKFNQNAKFKNSQKNIHHLIEIIKIIRNLRSELNIPYKTYIEIEISNKNRKTIEFLKIYKTQICQLLKINNIHFKSSTNVIPDSAYIVLSKTTLVIPLKGLIDTKSEVSKIKLKKDKLVNSLKDINLRLTNSSFINKAPEKIINQYKKQAYDIKSSIEKIDQIIDTIR